ncbi:acetoacetyl-CoA synthetase [Caerostris darwini]|uniref:Acetoacetyl-CoA synthetase n=1 Tax=Caerostris darwini TaxID=1538125 RepID=A0AAV4T1P2_9ARAC|nr:acetoacetyl-CoA synthetase [Caerostris darwini]
MFRFSNGGAHLTKNGFVDILENNPIVVWDKKVPNTELEKFKNIVEKKYGKNFDSYWDLHKWSIENYTDFWREIWNYFDVVASKPFDEVLVKTGSGFLDNEWFSGARLNFAENLMRIRDNRIALMCLDELGNEDSVTFAEMFEEVRLYAAAFRKQGLTVGDRVACIMTNRKEAMFAMLATTSIGAIWSGPLPFHGARAISNLVKFVDPKIIFALDHFQDEGEEIDNFDKLVEAAKATPNVKKVIVLATRQQSINRLSEIPKSMLLEDFLQSGKHSDGTLPELVFEQLPFDHPIAINFTSGTTGLPKGVLHSAGTFIAVLRDFGLHLNLRNGDTVYTYCPVGWSVWDNPIPSLALGVKLFLFSGSAKFPKKGFTLWDCLSKYKCTYACLTPACLDYLEKNNVVPQPGMNFDSLKVVALGASPSKIRNFEFLHNRVNKNLFVSSIYGATEVFGAFSGFDLNLPSYSSECQVPSLGVDLHVFDDFGTSVVGKRGEMVVTTPTPSFPVYLWNDKNNAKLKETYFSKYEGVWSQNDEGWINPTTKGIVVIGRSDDTLKQDGERFCAGDVYFGIDKMEELQDFICVGQDRWNGETRAVLLVKMRKGYEFTEELKEKIAETIKREVSDDYIPKLMLEIPDIPYNLNHKRMESTVKKILATNTIPEVSNIKNRESLQYYLNIPEVLSYNEK